MRIDAELLRWCAAADDRAVFRAYGWARPTLSLGRAEPFPEGWDTNALAAAGVDVVRRPTGGDAVLHDGELAFAAAVSLPGRSGLSPRSFANLVADAVAEAMRRMGVDAARSEAADAATPRDAGENRVIGAASRAPGVRPCFARTEPGEVRAAGYKIAGIASRFTRGAALSHASIPLSPAHRNVASFRRDGAMWRDVLDGHARAVPELIGRNVEPEALGRAIAEAFGSHLERALEPATFAVLGLEAALDRSSSGR